MKPHIPGQTPRPAQVPAGVQSGLALYRAGYFWEAHEAWEPVWLATPPAARERAFLQGAIQLANARLKLAMGRPRAAARIAPLAEAAFARAGAAPCFGLTAHWAEGELSEIRGALAKQAQ